MKAFSAGLTLVNVATMAGLLLGIVGGGLDEGFAGLALLLGLAAAIYAWIGTAPFSLRKAAAAPPLQLPKSKRARRRMKLDSPTAPPPPPRRWHFWACAVGIVFAMFAVRSFCWLLWIDGNNLKIQSPNNLGDLALHITYIKYFANGIALWPDNPIHVFSSLRYPAGIDLFDSLLLLQHVDLIRALVWTGLLGSLATFYGTRLGRAYLGASDPARPKSPSESVPLPGDDMDLSKYEPHAHAGPLHLINVTVNETFAGRSQVEQRDRKGMGMAIGPAGVSVGVRHHAAWGDGRSLAPTKDPGTGTETFRVFPHAATIQPRWPTLARWMAISGAAVSTGLGARTSVGLSFLIGVFNFRLGHWWRSGVDPKVRKGGSVSQPPSHLARLAASLASFFPVQAHLLGELLGRFPGTSHRDWYLSDGGHFENTGAYELVRRRLALIIVCDNGADPEGGFDDLGNLVRKVRVDFGAHVTFFTRDDLDRGLSVDERSVIGTLDDIGFAAANLADPSAPRSSPADRRPTRHAALALVTYEGSDDYSFLLWLRPCVLGNEPIDVLNYRARHPEFPEQSTGDQFFDDAQWESYRRLGEFMAWTVFKQLRSQEGSPADGWKPFEIASFIPRDTRAARSA
jgi:hypothetical protein